MPFELKRRPKTLSYSAWSTFEVNREEYFMQYLADVRAPRFPQENYAAVGSAFDAFVKFALHAALFGAGSDPNYEFGKLFEDQVEPQNWDFGLRAGKHVFQAYKQTGAYGELLNLLKKAVEPPRFESKIESKIGSGVPFLGKPDLRFILKNGDHPPLRVILDWKVKGYCSVHGASPSKGYALCRDGYDAIAIGEGKTKKDPLGKQSKSHNSEHDKYLAYDHRGLTINAGFMENCNPDYANQVSTYGWMLGETPGDENTVVWIDEIVAKYMGEGKQPLLRVANHRARVSRDHQLNLLSKIEKCWDAITSGHIFTDMSREDSDSRCEVLEATAASLKTDGSAEEQWFNDATRSSRW